MRILLVGAGGVGTALARIAARRSFAELIIADYGLTRAQHAAAARAPCTSSAWTARTRFGSAPPACRRATWWPRACPTRPRWATR